ESKECHGRSAISATFNKSEILRSKRIIGALFENGKSVYSFPLKAVFLNVEHDARAPVQVLFVVPKKLFKRAHDRNLIRRRMKEAYRTRKSAFYQELTENKNVIAMALIYT